MASPDIDPSYLIRELKDVLRGLRRLTGPEHRRFFSLYLGTLLEMCTVMHPMLYHRSTRDDNDLLADCILLTSEPTDHVLNRFLKRYV